MDAGAGGPGQGVEGRRGGRGPGATTLASDTNTFAHRGRLGLTLRSAEGCGLRDGHSRGLYFGQEQVLDWAGFSLPSRGESSRTGWSGSRVSPTGCAVFPASGTLASPSALSWRRLAPLEW